MLRTRLFLNLLPFVVILLAIGVYAIALLARLAGNVDTTVAENYHTIITAQALRLALGSLDRQVWIALSETNGDLGKAAEDQGQFESNLASLAKSLPLPGEQTLREQLVSDYRELRSALDALPSLREFVVRREWYGRQIAPHISSLDETLENIRKLNTQAVFTTSAQIHKINRDVTRLMVIGLAVALVISAYACYQSSRSILQPIQLLTKATTEVGAGNWDKPVPILSRDELGDLAKSFNQMAAQLQQYRQSTSEKIVRLHDTMETTLASFPDPIFVLNKEGRIELKNPAADELAASLRLNQELPARLRTLAQQALATGENFLPHSFDEVASYRVNGSDKFFLPRVVAMRTKEEALFGVAVALYDVTRFRLLDSAKTNLVATVSHELKTPLTSVRMTLYLMLEKALGALTPKQEELLQAARNDADRLLRILNDLLDLARLEEGDAALQKERVAPAELLRTAMAEMSEQVAAQGLKLTCDAAPHLPAVFVDRQRINHVFSNLIANAIKHSPSGGEIRLRAASAEDSSVQFSVSDQGPGIPEEYQTRIFDRFFRVPGQTKTGAGLGLSIAREITVAHGGRIAVRSAPGQGSAFQVVLKGATG